MTLSTTSLIASDSLAPAEKLISDFTNTSPDLRWYVVNDNVMGGKSEGDFMQNQGELIFSGSTNTNGGGFSSIRSGPMQMDLSSHEGIRLSLKGDGRRYTWRLTTVASWRGRVISYLADFATQEGTWSTVDVPFTRFVPRLRGRRLNGPELDPAKITGMGLMIYDKQDGPFKLSIDNIFAYPSDDQFTLASYKWKNRVLIVSVPSDDDKHLVDLKNELMAAPWEFESRDMILVILLDAPESGLRDRRLTFEEIDATRTTLGIRPGEFAIRLIGKDGSVKLATESPTPMNDIYALIDSMPMRASEKQNR
ncbi:MAG: NADH dehydrogenase [ubiquinone] 1 alpha subcomplex assembly factor 1 [Halieaceae bacterium]|jgi:NADH dehydrogenase [ubiquinone] 1 alpha subcomplex assembly factor 1